MAVCELLSNTLTDFNERIGRYAKLQQQIQTGIVDEHLIIRDMNANIVVDYMFDVMCAKC